MDIRIESRHLEDVVVLVPDIFQDSRGFFTETFRADQFEAHGLPIEYVQDNHSRSVKGVVRGLHFQWHPAMAKLMRVTVGSAFLVAVEIQYKCTGIYNNKGEAGIRWNDPAIGIKWPLQDVIVSDKDRVARTLEQWLASPESDNFRYSSQLEPAVSLRS